MNNLITGSIVLFHNSKDDLIKVINSFLGSDQNVMLFLIDNSSNNELSFLSKDRRVHYIFNNDNLGFGKAHNIAFEEAYRLNSSYHVLLNPDVFFDSKILRTLLDKSQKDQSIGLLSPKIIYPNGDTQYLCKLIPNPIDLIIRRFTPIESIKNRLENKYELRFFNYNEEADIPILSGCFMFIKTEVLKQIEGFDERYFMYLEDVDLCRRVGKISKVVFYPEVEVVHNYEKGSYKNKRLLLYHIKSAIKYFNKWGWFFDSKRKEINTRTMKKLNYKKNERNNTSRR